MGMRFSVMISFRSVKGCSEYHMYRRESSGKIRETVQFSRHQRVFFVCGKGLCVRGFDNIRCTGTTSLSAVYYVIGLHQILCSTIYEFGANVGWFKGENVFTTLVGPLWTYYTVTRIRCSTTAASCKGETVVGVLLIRHVSRRVRPTRSDSVVVVGNWKFSRFQ